METRSQKNISFSFFLPIESLILRKIPYHTVMLSNIHGYATYTLWVREAKNVWNEMKKRKGILRVLMCGHGHGNLEKKVLSRTKSFAYLIEQFKKNV